MLGITHFTVHEAEIAVYHAWGDGIPVHGPGPRHTASALAMAYRAGLSIKQSSVGERLAVFADWRLAGRSIDREWTIETSAPLAAITDLSAPVSSFLPPGSPLLIVVRFLCSRTGQWRVFQFHDACPGDSEAAETGQNMMTGYSFQAGWLEEFAGGPGVPAPDLKPRMVGTIEWCHAGRIIPCWYFDAAADTWTEGSQNAFVAEAGTARYVSLDFDGDDVSLSYMAARTGVAPTPAAGLESATLGWIDAATLEIRESSGLTLKPGWSVQSGCPEPLTLPPSGRHWEHPVVRFRFLGRIYASLAYGIVALPSLEEGGPAPFIDFPMRLGRLLLLPGGAYLLPASP